MTIKEMANAVKDYLILKGWYNLAKPNCEGSICDGNGVCFGLAIARVLSFDDANKFRRVVAEKLKFPDSNAITSFIYRWNDSQTSARPIYELLDSIIADEEAKENV